MIYITKLPPIIFSQKAKLLVPVRIGQNFGGTIADNHKYYLKAHAHVLF